MKKIILPKAALYLIGNFVLGIGTGLSVQAHQGVGPNISFPYTLFTVAPFLTTGHWFFVTAVPFWIVTVIFTRELKVSGLFSFLGAVVSAEFTDLGILMMSPVHLTSIVQVCLAIIVATVLFGFGFACIKMSDIPASPVVFFQMEISRFSSSWKHPVSFARWMLYGNFFFVILAVITGSIGAATGAYGPIHGTSEFQKITYGAFMVFRRGGIGVGTLFTGFFFPYCITYSLIFLRRSVLALDELKTLHIRMNYNILEIFRRP